MWNISRTEKGLKMKAYEKQLKTTLEKKRSISLAEEWIARKFWRAALEWVKSRSQIAKSLYMIDVNDIDEELR